MERHRKEWVSAVLLMGLTEDLIGTELNDLETLERIEDEFNEVGIRIYTTR